MKTHLTYILISTLMLCSCEGNKKCDDTSCKAPLACKLTTSEFRERKATILASLKQQVIGKKELNQGYSFKFAASDAIHKQLDNFIKTEKECCSFFEFKITDTEDKTAVWCDITGPEGVKQFITTELGL